MNYRMKPDALWHAYQTIERETSMTDQKRRMEDQLPEQRIDWEHGGEPSSEPIRVERQQALLNCAAALLKAESASCTAVVFPGSEPQQFVMIGTADDILRLLPLPGATDGLLRATMREITTLLVENENVDHLFNDPDLVRLLSALTTMAVRRAAASPSAAPAAGQAGLAKAAQAIYESHKAACLTDPVLSLKEMTRDDEEILVDAKLILDLCNALAAPVAADTEQAIDELSDEEQAALDRLDKPEWRAASHLKLRAVLAVEVSNSIRMGAKIENLQDELRATEGYRRGYTDGTTDAAGMADVQNDWRGIWDEAPVQGEGVLATDGATVIAARWFATGWAKHDHFSDELEYLPEGWVTHWKPFPPAQDANAQGGK